MAAKLVKPTKPDTRKKFSVQRRYEVWVEQTIYAESFEEALAWLRGSTIENFLTFEGDCVDFNQLSGDAVLEQHVASGS